MLSIKTECISSGSLSALPSSTTTMLATVMGGTFLLHSVCTIFSVLDSLCIFLCFLYRVLYQTSTKELKLLHDQYMFCLPQMLLKCGIRTLMLESGVLQKIMDYMTEICSRIKLNKYCFEQLLKLQHILIGHQHRHSVPENILALLRTFLFY